MKLLSHVHVPGYSALILRKTYSELSLSGGLIPVSHEWFGDKDCTWNGQQHQWSFPTGEGLPDATISFGYLAKKQDHYRYKSSEFQRIAFDELTQFPYHQYKYMFSRCRMAEKIARYGVPIQVLSASNPGDVGHEWVYRRFIRDGSQRDCVFLPGTLEDNPYLNRESYEEMLAELGPVEYARLRHGNWLVKREGLVHGELESCVVPHFEDPPGERVGGIDFGFNNPFGAVRATLDHDNVLWINYERYERKCPISRHAKELPKDVSRWYADPAGADQIAELVNARFKVYGCTHLGDRPLLAGIDMVNSRIENGTLKISERLVNLREEAGSYAYTENTFSENPVDAHNHLMSALRYMVVGVDRYRSIPKDAGIDPNAQKASVDNPAFWR